jgi:hypothetical protein
MGGASMKEKPILFCGEMVRAIMNGTKTQTRRVIKCYPGGFFKNRNPYCRGDLMWLRETWAPHPDDAGSIIFRATDLGWDEEGGIKWHPSIFMRRVDSRITLEITDVRAQKVQDITAEDAYCEGIPRPIGPMFGSVEVASDNARNAFRTLWNSINSERGYGWDVNPNVWAVTFRRVKP